MTLLDNPSFAEAFAKLEGVSLNPRRHTAKNAKSHSLAVSKMAGRLAHANQLAPTQTALLEDLGLAHDIGKITGTAAPAKSLDVLADIGDFDSDFLALVKWHDTSLPWWRSDQRGQGPSDKAWSKLGRSVDMKMLCLFMIADRVDAPGGWYRNAPTRWFIDEARRRGLVDGLIVHLPDFPSERSAGVALERAGGEVLFIERGDRLELPKGGIEFDETARSAALRELEEETGFAAADVELTQSLGALTYETGEGDARRLKQVRYFAAVAHEERSALSKRAHWANPADVADELVSEDLARLLF